MAKCYLIISPTNKCYVWVLPDWGASILKNSYLEWSCYAYHTVLGVCLCVELAGREGGALGEGNWGKPSVKVLVRETNVSAVIIWLPHLLTHLWTSRLAGGTQTAELEDFLYVAYTVIWKVVEMVSLSTACSFQGENWGNLSFTV